jgi:hypothetical protein
MEERAVLQRRIRVCRTVLVLQIAVQLAFSVVVWNSPDVHRHLFNILGYASLFIQAGLALILGRHISEAKQELGTLDRSVDL